MENEFFFFFSRMEIMATESTCQCKRCRFNLWVKKMLWRRKWQPTSVLLPGKFHGQGSLVGYSLWDCKESDTTERTAHSTRHLIPLFLKGSLGFNHMEVPPRSYLQQISCISTLVEACCYASRKLVSGELEEHKNLFF